MKFLDICKNENRGKWFEVVEGVAKGELVRVTESGVFEYKPIDKNAEIGINVVAYTLGESLENVVSDKPYAKPYTLIEALTLLNEAHLTATELPLFISGFEDNGKVLAVNLRGEVGMAYENHLHDDDLFCFDLHVESILGNWYLKE